MPRIIKDTGPTVVYDKFDIALLRKLVSKPTEVVITYKELGSSGLELRHFPSGKADWSYYYRFGDRKRRYQIGRFPAKDLRKARAEWGALRADVQGGTDPVAGRNEARGEATQARVNTVSTLWARYISEELPAYWGASGFFETSGCG